MKKTQTREYITPAEALAFVDESVVVSMNVEYNDEDKEV